MVMVIANLLKDIGQKTESRLIWLTFWKGRRQGRVMGKVRTASVLVQPRRGLQGLFNLRQVRQVRKAFAETAYWHFYQILPQDLGCLQNRAPSQALWKTESESK